MRKPSIRGMIRAARVEVDSFCEEWIGYALPPASRTVEEAEWSRAERGGYCHRCGQTVGRGEASVSGCGACRGASQAMDGIVRLDSYGEHMRQWVLQIKYNCWSEMAQHLGRELGRAVKEAKVVELKRAVVVPMPMPWMRRFHRGIDHAEVIAQGVAAELAAPMVKALAKANGPTQLGVPKSARAVNARRGMRVKWRWGGWPLKGLQIVLVDDVRTSGSSMAAAARLLRSLGVKRVVGAVLAVAEAGRRSQSGVEQASGPLRP